MTTGQNQETIFLVVSILSVLVFPSIVAFYTGNPWLTLISFLVGVLMADSVR